MAGASTYLQQRLLDHALKGSPYSQPANIYVSLHSGDTGETGTNEILAAGRQLATTVFGAAGPTSKTTIIDLFWPSMPAGWVTHVCIWDAPTGGNPLFLGPLVTPRTLDLGDTYRIPSGSLTITMD